MIRSDKKLNELAQILTSSNPDIVLNAITKMRNEDPFAGAIGLLTETYDRSDNQIIKNNIRDFMNDIKESSAREEIIYEINRNHTKATIAMLVASCWQSGLDYSLYIADFARAFNNGDYATAIECYTVIEESYQYLTRKNRDEIITILEENKTGNPPDKLALMNDLVTILS